MLDICQLLIWHGKMSNSHIEAGRYYNVLFSRSSKYRMFFEFEIFYKIYCMLIMFIIFIIFKPKADKKIKENTSHCLSDLSN